MKADAWFVRDQTLAWYGRDRGLASRTGAGLCSPPSGQASTRERTWSAGRVGVDEQREPRDAAIDEVADGALGAVHPLRDLRVAELAQLVQRHGLAVVLGQLVERGLDAPHRLPHFEVPARSEQRAVARDRVRSFGQRHCLLLIALVAMVIAVF